jgi:hypothetical protein
MGGARAAGVCWHRQNKRWIATISVSTGNGESKLRYLGSFVNEVEAALAYDQAAREHHKDKAKLNFPGLPPQPQAASNKSSQYRGRGGGTWAPGILTLGLATSERTRMCVISVDL